MVMAPAWATTTFCPPARIVAVRGASGFAATASVTAPGPRPIGLAAAVIHAGRFSTAQEHVAPVWMLMVSKPPAIGDWGLAGVTVIAQVVPVAGENSRTRCVAGVAHEREGEHTHA